MTNESIYLRGLNGIRAIAATGVLINHAKFILKKYYYLESAKVEFLISRSVGKKIEK